jgi:cellobiose-specific phosphotransferase system component IIC
MFDLVINTFIIFLIIYFTSIIIHQQKNGNMLDNILTKYQDSIFVARTYVKIIGIIIICWLSIVNIYLGVLGAILFIMIMEYEYNNELDRNINNSEDVKNNKLYKTCNKVDYFTAENFIKPKPSLGVDKSLFNSTSTINPYEMETNYNNI